MSAMSRLHICAHGRACLLVAAHALQIVNTVSAGNAITTTVNDVYQGM
jgi:hypothetical protein